MTFLRWSLLTMEIARRCGRCLGPWLAMGIVAWVWAAAAAESPQLATTNATAAAPAPIQASSAAAGSPEVGGGLASEVAVEGPTLAQVEAQLEGLKADSKLDEDTRKRVAERLESARTMLQAAAESQRRAQSLAELIASGATRTQELTAQLRDLDGAVSNELVTLRREAAGLSLDALTQRMAVEQAAEVKLKGELDAVAKRSTALETRPARGREERSTAEQRLKALETELAAPAAAGLTPREAEAQKLMNRASVLAARAEVARLDQELLSLPIEAKLRLAERSLFTRQSERQQARLKVLDELTQRMREAEVRQVRRETAQAERQARQEHPVVQSLAATNQWYAKELEATEQLLLKVRGAAEALKTQRTRLDEDVARTERQLAIAGLSEPMGEFLLDQRRRLLEAERRGPAVAVGAEVFRVSVRMIATNGLRRFQAEELLRKLAGVEDEVDEWYAAGVTTPLAQEEEADVRGKLRDLFLKQRDVLTRLVVSYTGLMEALSDALAAQTELRSRQTAHLESLEKQLIWIPSSLAVSSATFRELPRSLKGLFGGEARAAWFSAVRDLRHPVPMVAVTLLLIGLIVLRGRFVTDLGRLADLVRKASTDRPGHTIRALLVSMALGVPMGTAVLLWGRALVSAASVGPARAVGEGLAYCGGFLTIAMTAWELCRPRGVAEAHFRWPSASLDVLRRNLRWWVPFHSGVVFLAASGVYDTGRESYDSLARLVFVVGMIVLTGVMVRVLHPEKGVFAVVLVANPDGWWSRTRRLWYLPVALLPLGIAALSLAGYTYTSLRLTHQFFLTLGFVAAAVVLHGVVKRWFVVQERRIAIEKALERRRDARAAKEAADGEASSEGGEAPMPVEEPELDLATVKEQTRRLLRVLLWVTLLVGVYLLWAPLLPALGFLDQKAIWTVSSTGEGGAPVTVAITVSSILGAVVILLLTLAAVRNLPGVLEIAILERLPLQPGSRYAITSITSYLLIVIGGILVAGNLGVRWSQLSWIAAALSVGLGFGLQEIVANFFCGLLIFFERPIRVGDIVTVNEITGVVSQIRIRATTIQDWDRKEYIVPNKEFITGRILNWTLTNTINRVVITVGAAYGSDTERASALMREAAEQHPEVMKDPAPTCFFESFDASSLRLVLRFFLSRLDRRLQTIHELHTEIDRRFKQAGIEIAFPQQDIHIRTVAAAPPLLETRAGRGT